MGDLSPHFSRSEFRCKGFGKPGHQDHDTPVASNLLESLEDLRFAIGRPLAIVSGHRCVWWNYRVGGAKLSRHVVGDAADIPYGYATEGQAAAAGFMGIGTRDGWAVHVDRRPNRSRWRY